MASRYIQHDNIEVLKTGKVAVFIGWYSQITIHFQRVLLAGGLSRPHLQPPANGFHSANAACSDDQQRPALRGDHDIFKKSPNPEAAMPSRGS